MDFPYSKKYENFKKNEKIFEKSIYTRKSLILYLKDVIPGLV